MYAKIYEEIFIKNYALKKKIRENIWLVKIDNTDYKLYVYNDNEFLNGYKCINEAELLEYRNIKNTLLRIEKNKEFLKKIKKYRESNSYLFKTSKNDQQCLFNFDTFTL